MSTQLLEPPVSELDAPADACAPTPRAEGLSFDLATRHRLALAERVADTLESLSDVRAWDRLDPALQFHLLAQAQRLEEHVARLGSQRVVRSVEDEALRLKRLERRLGIAVEHMAPPEAGQRVAGGMFLGDFTEAELLEGAGDAPREGKRKPARKDARKSAKAAIGEGMRRFRNKAERAAARASSRRITFYVVAGVVLTGLAVGWNLRETHVQSREVSRPPSAGFQMNEYLGDLQVFLPATATTLRNRDIRVIVSNEWLLRTAQQRRIDAEGAHVFLSNRNVTGLMICFEDGLPLARYMDGKGQWFDPSTPGQPVAPQRAVD